MLADADAVARTLAIISIVLTVAGLVFGRTDTAWSRRSRGVVELRSKLKDIRAVVTQHDNDPFRVSAALWSTRVRAEIALISEDVCPNLADRTLRKNLRAALDMCDEARGEQPSLDEAGAGVPVHPPPPSVRVAQEEVRKSLKACIDRIDEILKHAK